MGIDGMRVGGSRCPPLLVGGLILACLMLICNWWTLSSENLELLRQIDELSEQLKISAEERDQCVTLRGNLEDRFKRAKDEIASLHVHLEQQSKLKKRTDELEDSITVCKSELDSLNKLDATKTATLETLRLEKDTISTQLGAKKEENKKLQEELDRIQDELKKLKSTYSSPSEKEHRMLPQFQTSTRAETRTNDSQDIQDEGELDELKIRPDLADEMNRLDDASNADDNLRFMDNKKGQQTKSMNYTMEIDRIN
ncbi:Golgi membrane protein 1 isoform X1 [Orussus abietinus]|uniref:Golgi membrane protein 1 isoform X1 n=1 Tax=Orussus abietinus TaxID=222816 RepID=UPI0006264AB9|nr:Golgi membrane protein 1 isoform X1 [Orussus abietinus]